MSLEAIRKFFHGPAVLAILAAAATVPVAPAQIQAGRIVGTVFDESRAVIPGAEVTVSETATNVVHAVATDGAGNYVVTPLNPGFYNVTATAPGFQTLSKTGIELQVGQIARVDLTLSVGETTTTVEVSGAIPLLETDTGTVGQVIGNEKITELPLNGRNFTELARLATGAAMLPGGGNLLRIRPNFISGTTIGGVRGRQVSFILDGVDVSEQHQGGTFIQTSIDALQEFRVQQNAYSAEHSRSGALLNVTTKSGGNALHGTAFEFLRNEKLDARDFFAREREQLKRNQFGGQASGAIVKNKVFFMGSYEGLRERQGLVFNNIVPTAAMKNGDFSAPGLERIFDPLTTAPGADGQGVVREQFANNVIPQSRLSPQSQFFNDFIPLPNTPGGTASFAPSNKLDQDQFTVRADWKLNENHSFFARYSIHDNRLSNPNRFPALGLDDLTSRGQNVATSLTSTFGANVIHEFRFNFMVSSINLNAFLQGTDFNALAGITGFEDTRLPGVEGAFPDIVFSGFDDPRGAAFDQRPKTQDREVFEYTDTLTWIKGKHILKFGTKIRDYFPLFSDSKQFVGLWNFTGVNTQNPGAPTGTGNPIADFALGFPFSGQRAFPGNTFGGLGTYWHFFAQDDFKVSNRLTLNLGLRYEYTPWLRGFRGQLGTFDPTRIRPIIIASDTDQIDLDAQFAAPTAFPLFADLIQTTSQAGLPIELTDPDYRQWAPRLGLAWRPFGENTVIRAGYGIFYEPENTDGRVNLNMVPFKWDETVFNPTNGVPDRTFGNFFLGAPIGGASTAPSISPTKTKLEMGYDQHWSFGIQRQLTSNTMMSVDYVGNKGTFLNSSNAFNDPSAGPGGVQARRPFPMFSSSSFLAQDSSSTYHSLQAKTERRLDKGFSYLVSYTYSKTTWRQNTPQVGGNTAFEKGVADFDIPHNFITSFNYELPFGRGKRFLSGGSGVVDKLFGGWTVQSILGHRSGRPFTPTISRDVANIGRGGQRPNRLGEGTLENPTVERYFDTSAFVLPDPFTFGNSGVRILQEDSAEFIDFSFFKNTMVNERIRIQFRAEFFNLTNSPSFNAPQTNIDTAAAGRVTSTSNTPRQIQFGLKVFF